MGLSMWGLSAMMSAWHWYVWSLIDYGLLFLELSLGRGMRGMGVGRWGGWEKSELGASSIPDTFTWEKMNISSFRTGIIHNSSHFAGEKIEA